MTKFIDLTGKSFGEIQVISRSKENKGTSAQWECICHCGNQFQAVGSNLTRGAVKSCGCSRKSMNVKHGQCRRTHTSKEYMIWASMIRRCHVKTDKGYAKYGGRGIKVCERWRESFENFFVDMGSKPEGFSIDRKDNNKGYSPDNCKWSTATEQALNKGIYKSNKSGNRGVYWRNNRWQVYLRRNKKSHFIGCFTDLESAITARQQAELTYDIGR